MINLSRMLSLYPLYCKTYAFFPLDATPFLVSLTSTILLARYMFMYMLSKFIHLLKQRDRLKDEPWCKPMMMGKTLCHTSIVLTQITTPSYISLITSIYLLETSFFSQTYHLGYPIICFFFPKSVKTMCKFI